MREHICPNSLAQVKRGTNVPSETNEWVETERAVAFVHRATLNPPTRAHGLSRRAKSLKSAKSCLRFSGDERFGGGDTSSAVETNRLLKRIDKGLSLHRKHKFKALIINIYPLTFKESRVTIQFLQFCCDSFPPVITD